MGLLESVMDNDKRKSYNNNNGDTRNNRNNNDRRNNNNRNNNDRRNNNHNSNYKDNNDNRNNNKYDKKNNNNHNNKSKFDTKLAGIYRSKGTALQYNSRDKIKKAIVSDFPKLVKDLKKWKKDNGPMPHYAINAVYDVTFASALGDSKLKIIKKAVKDKKIKKKHLKHLHEQMLMFIKEASSGKLNSSFYGEETIKDMCSIYYDILADQKKDEYSKLKEKFPELTDAQAVRLAILSSASIKESLYSVLGYMYEEVADVYKGDVEDVEDDDYLPFFGREDDLLKLFNILYGKEKRHELLLYLLLEIRNKKNRCTPKKNLLWGTLDSMMREELEKLSKKDIESILNKFIDIRIAEEKGKKFFRRLGNRQTIHAGDFPKLTKVFENMESDDITIKQFFR